jgi:hypothetical protein
LPSPSRSTRIAPLSSRPGIGADFVERRGWVGSGDDLGLALAVVSETAGFQHGGTANLFERPRKIFGVIDFGKRGRLKSKRRHELLFGQPVLRCREHIRVGPNGFAACEKLCVPAAAQLELALTGSETAKFRHDRRATSLG